MKLPFAFGNKGDSSESGPGLEPVWGGDGASQDQEVHGLSDLYSPDKAGESHVYDIVDVLLDMGDMTEEQHAELRRREKANPSCDVAELLADTGWIEAADILAAKARLYDMDFRRISAEDVDAEAFEKLDVDYIRESCICPIGVEDGLLVVATSEPANVFAIEDVKRQTQMEVHVVVCSREDIEAVCDSFKQVEKIDYNLDEIISDMTDVEVVQDEEEESEDLERMAGQSPVIKFVNYVISNAIREGASDIHIEPKDKSMRTRYRIDGVLFEMMQSPLQMHPAIVSRIKIMANLDISERRLPQDGKISVIVGGRGIDLRVSTLPTSHGEKVVIRVLDSKSILRGLEQLGMEPEVMASFAKQVALPHGILLVTGPTGSGKSTTLYSALSQMDGDKLNISTVEDPVEYQLDFCNQVQANEKIGLDFAVALRSLLRQDPDVIMIGEIRDNETARIAVQAALTGHLVLSTLHTNDAASSITRLVNIGIDAYLIAASLNGVLAQRLVRRICTKCKEPYQAPDHMRKYVETAGAEPEQLFCGKGCEQCRGSGYLGRVGIYEFLIIDEAFRDMINKDPSVSNMRRVFHESGCQSLFDDGIMKVKQGLTTIEEVLRVTEVYGKKEDEELVENIE
ncbi:MAG: Flp pilus assembly complex ATPase component TadA [Phycisphaerae bacterium]|nr:Flp pilus assembly complex ATPase component TadA [Phycisphaerae bacterium]